VGRVSIPMGRVGWSELVIWGDFDLGRVGRWGEFDLTRNPSTDFGFEALDRDLCP